MAGLGLLALLGLRATVGIGNMISDAYHKSSPAGYLNDGTPYYCNRKSEMFAPNGEKIVSDVGYRQDGRVYTKYVGQRTGKVYIDPEVEYQKRVAIKNEEAKKRAIEMGRLAYLKYDTIRKTEVTCEIATDKYIACLRGKSDGTYYKFYLPDSELHSLMRIKEGDEGIQITQEEYDKLNIYGTHHAADVYRNTFVWDNRKKKYILVPRKGR